MTNTSYDVIIIGGSYAGLSTAMALGRSLRNVLIIDSGLPCNRQTPQSHNFITQDGQEPGVITQKAKAQVLAYNTVKFLHDLAISGRKIDNGFVITTQSNSSFQATKLVFASGMKDIMPDIKGFAACWGISVIHCPYCHGYEYRGQNTAMIANGDRAFHLASLVSNLTPQLTILTSGKADFKPEQMAKLKHHEIKVIDAKITEIEHQNGHLRQIIFEDGKKLAFDVAYGSVPFVQHSDIPASLGCELTEQGQIKVDGFQKTTLSGVFACGDSGYMMRTVASAVFSGNLAGVMVNNELATEQF
ncbi:NAD(P)/FAD-dependent oxidoreductase [Spirosoma pollinicola]|uniref:Pyridine nucleotide-disulfide oxidoreductase n=1 Tax=Spirosoma pollinicola TaxID=2057025 RepID=A0A2K8Z7V1_9BACT|nr:NAD(P)/FAD-dependent oxidoreductase [Spirosoma pollinicola]AUD05966.1 pyridine nucleotide-disulfide oxidoreductase [Spirosoma pollinicola]